jgi:hypothetical protein
VFGGPGQGGALRRFDRHRGPSSRSDMRRSGGLRQRGDSDISEGAFRLAKLCARMILSRT